MSQFIMLNRLTLDRLDLRPKLILAFVLVALLVGVTGIVGYQAVSAVDADAHTISEDADKIDASMEILVAVEEQQIAVQAAMLEQEGARAKFDESESDFNEWAAAMERQDLTAEEQEAFDSLQTTHDEYVVVAQELFEAKQAGDTELVH